MLCQTRCLLALVMVLLHAKHTIHGEGEGGREAKRQGRTKMVVGARLHTQKQNLSESCKHSSKHSHPLKQKTPTEYTVNTTVFGKFGFGILALIRYYSKSLSKRAVRGRMPLQKALCPLLLRKIFDFAEMSNVRRRKSSAFTQRVDLSARILRQNNSWSQGKDSQNRTIRSIECSLFYI